MPLVERDTAYPDGLTPPERRVLDYLREGTLDAEIAVRLGLPIGDVKDRIQRMLQKTGRRTRAELAVWVPDAPREPDPLSEAVIGEYVIGLYPESVAPQDRRRRWGVALATVAAMLAIAAAAWFTWARESPPPQSPPALYDSGERLEYTEVVAADDARHGAVPPVRTASVALIDGIEVREFRYEDPVPFPANTAMIVAMGCWQCDGPATSLVRLWSGGDGGVRTTVLFQPEPGAGGFINFIRSYAVSPDGNSLAVALCSKEPCPWHDRTEPGGELAIHWSDDGGASWRIVGATPGWSQIAAVNRRGVLIATPALGADVPATADYLYFPGGPVVFPPVSGNVVPIGAAGDSVAWAVLPNGPLILPGGGTADWFSGLRQVVSLLPGLHAGYHIAWQMGGNSAPISYIGFIGDQGRLRSAARLPLGNGPAQLGGLIDNFHLAGNAPVPVPGGGYAWSPVIFTPSGPTITPIIGPFEEGGRNLILAVSGGPFAEVNTPGDCLNLRNEPGGEPSECLPDKALVRPGPEQDGWMQVTKMAGEPATGWVKLEYLVR